MSIDKGQLWKAIYDGSDLGVDRVKDMPREDMFVDGRGAVWERNAPAPTHAETHHVFGIFFDEDKDVVKVYGSPSTDKFFENGFLRWTIERKVVQSQSKAILVPAVVSSMTLEVFKREIGEDLWDAWVRALKRHETREAAEQMQAGLEEILGALKDEARTDADVRAFARNVATSTLSTLDLLEEPEEDETPSGPPGPNGAEAPATTD